MKVQRTGAKRGESPTWYVQADREEEKAAIRAGLLQERSPDPRWRHVLAWGFESRPAAEAAMERLGPEVERAVQMVLADEVVQAAQVVLARLFLDEARFSTHVSELGGFVRRLDVLAGDLRDDRLGALASELRKWETESRRLHVRLVDTVQMGCLLMGVKRVDG